MSYSETAMKTMGKTNASWGICGFTSSLYAMYDLNSGARGMLINAPQAWSVLYEIEEYLELLQRQNERPAAGVDRRLHAVPSRVTATSPSAGI